MERGLNEIQSIEALMLSDEDVAELKSRGLFDRVEAKWGAPVVTEEIAGLSSDGAMSSGEFFGWDQKGG